MGVWSQKIVNSPWAGLPDLRNLLGFRTRIRNGSFHPGIPLLSHPQNQQKGTCLYFVSVSIVSCITISLFTVAQIHTYSATRSSKSLSYSCRNSYGIVVASQKTSSSSSAARKPPARPAKPAPATAMPPPMPPPEQCNSIFRKSYKIDQNITKYIKIHQTSTGTSDFWSLQKDIKDWDLTSCLLVTLSHLPKSYAPLPQQVPTSPRSQWVGHRVGHRVGCRLVGHRLADHHKAVDNRRLVDYSQRLVVHKPAEHCRRSQVYLVQLLGTGGRPHFFEFGYRRSFDVFSSPVPHFTSHQEDISLSSWHVACICLSISIRSTIWTMGGCIGSIRGTLTMAVRDIWRSGTFAAAHGVWKWVLTSDQNLTATVLQPQRLQHSTFRAAATIWHRSSDQERIPVNVLNEKDAWTVNPVWE